jgi:hypothetical protein
MLNDNIDYFWGIIYSKEVDRGAGIDMRREADLAVEMWNFHRLKIVSFRSKGLGIRTQGPFICRIKIGRFWHSYDSEIIKEVVIYIYCLYFEAINILVFPRNNVIPAPSKCPPGRTLGDNYAITQTL